MTNARILKKKVHEMANGTEYPDNGAGDFIEDGSEAVDEDIEQMEEEAGRFRWMPWVGIAAGIAVVAGAIYLSRHRAQRMLVKKGLQKGLQGGAVLALQLPGGLRKARDSADSLIRESARLWDRIPVRVVMK
jgi:hypothetical protein